MTRLAKRLAPRADPDDIVQDSLLRAWQRWSAYDAERGSPTTWLLAIVADKARDARVARLRRLRVIDDGVPPPDASAAVHVADVDIDRAISRLPTRQALAVHLYYFVGLSVAETGQVMDCSAGTVKSTLFDARENLRKTLGDCDD
jgi:RNA polymerase sigma-70 factor (ECF subfamily)